MTVLGEAFIEVHGDLKPFIRDLDRQVKKAAEAVEKDLGKAVTASLKNSGVDGRKLGDDIGDGIGEGIRRKTGDKTKPWWIQITAALGSALDDGLSALPAEVKAAIVLGIGASLPLMSAALAGATAAGLGLGVAVLGSLVATQFQEVQDAAKLSGNIIRESLARAAEPFSGAIVMALQEVTEFFLQSEQLFASLFRTASSFITPITDSILSSIEAFAIGIDEIDDKIRPFIDEFGDGIYVLTSALTEAFQILVNTGEEGQEGFRDLVYAVAQLVIGVARLIAFFTELYGIVRDVTLLLPALNPFAAFFFKMSDQAVSKTHSWSRAELELAASIKATLTPTKEQEKAIIAATKAKEDARKASFSLIDAEIDYQRAIDELSESLEVNGETLAFETEEGRKNLENLGDAIKAAQRRAEERLASGKLTYEQAKTLYQQEIQEILKVAQAHGVTEDAIRRVYGEAIDLVNLPAPSTGWLGNLATAAAKAAEQLERAKKAAQGLSGRGGKGTGGFTGFAEGGIVTEPTMSVLGEGGKPEVVIPLTNPSRAAQLAQQSGLTEMLARGVTLVQVFLGTERLEERMYRVVEQNNNSLANNMAFGARGL